MVFMFFAGLNALYFEFVIAQRRRCRRAIRYCLRAWRYAGVASFGLWTLVVVCGRLIPYLPTWG